MTGFVLDASVAIAWLFEDRARAETDALALRLVDAPAAAPAIWPWELWSVCLKKARQARLDPAGIAGLRVSVAFYAGRVAVEATQARALERAIDLAFMHRLSGYDAGYLELAIRRGMPLATLDTALARAARAEGVTVLPG